MKKFILSFLTIALLFVATPSIDAQEKGGKRDPANALVTQLLKSLEKASLTADQTAKIKEQYSKVAKEVAEKRTAGDVSADLMTKRNAARKAAQDAGTKGKDIQTKANAVFNADQLKVYNETEAMLTKARIEIGKLLSAEQIAKLPEQAQNQLKEKTGGKKGKKK